MGKPHPPHYALLLGLLLLITVAFGQVVGFGFLFWDDTLSITSNLVLLEDWSLRDYAWVFELDQTMRFMPLVWLARKAILIAFDLSPGAFHTGNLVFHALCASLLYGLVWQALGHFSSDESKRRWLAFAAAAFWAINPLRAEPVSWITAFSYPFATSFVLISLNLYLLALRDLPSGIDRRWFLLSIAAGLLAAMAYPITLTFGIAMVVADAGLVFHAFRRGRPLRRPDLATLLAGRLSHILGSITVLFLTVLHRVHAPGYYLEAPGVEQYPIIQRLLHATYSFVYLNLKPFVPTDLTPIRVIVSDLFQVTPSIVGAAVGVTLLLLLLLICWRRAWPIILFLAFQGLLCAPMLGLTEDFVRPTDRYTYLPSLTFVVGLACLAVRKINQHPRLPAIMGGLVLLCLTAMAFGQARFWRSNETFYRAFVDLSDHEFKEETVTHISEMFGNGHYQARNYCLAASYYGITAEYKPGNVHLLRKLGICLARCGRAEEALTVLRQSCEVEPDPGTAGLISRIEENLQLALPPPAAVE